MSIVPGVRGEAGAVVKEEPYPRAGPVKEAKPAARWCRVTSSPRVFSCIPGATNRPAHRIFPVCADSKTGRQQWILVDGGGRSIGLWSGLKTAVDAKKQEVPMERFEPSTLAGPVFETGAYTVPPHRQVT